MGSQYTRITFVITSELEQRLDGLKKEVYYNRSHSEMCRALIKAGLDAVEAGKTEKAPSKKKTTATAV